MHVAVTKQHSFEIAVLAKEEQRMIARALEVAVVGCAFLIAVRVDHTEERAVA